MKVTLYQLLSMLIFTGSLACGWVWMDFKGFMNNAVNLPVEGQDIEIRQGATFSSLSQRLINNGIIKSSYLLKIASKVYPELTHLKQGEYYLESGLTPYDLFKKIVDGKVKTYQVRFIEGWNFNQYRAVLADETKLRQELFNYENQQIIEKLNITTGHPEGWFYPDTFNYEKGVSDLQILQISHDLMKQKLQKYWQERDIGLPYEVPYDVLIMASIIEKETGLAGERDKIAGVFVRRLNKNMRLQTDPTVIYGMGQKFDGDIRSKDLKSDTAYNTYLHKGLPPTPIAMPSEASLSAAVHPAEGTELYFVAKGDGSHQFSTTLEEHNKAVRLYQLNKTSRLK